MSAAMSHLLVAKIQAGLCLVALRLSRLLFNANGTLLRIRCHRAIRFKGIRMMGKHTCIAGALMCAAQLRHLVVPVEDVFAQHQGARLVAHKLRPMMTACAHIHLGQLHTILSVLGPVGATAKRFCNAGRDVMRADE